MVYAAEDAQGRRLAIKLLTPAASRRALELRRFERSARIQSELKHAAIVRGFGQGTIGERVYILMEALEGPSLAAVLDERARLSEGETWRLLARLASALGYLWSRDKRYVHRDIKAENILFDRRGRAKLTDFGLAAGLVEGTRFTRTGESFGTPIYMAPERGLDSKSSDVRADLWSLGVLAYRCLTGVFPFAGEDFLDLHFKICTQAPRDADRLLAPIRPWLRALVLRLLEKDPADRFQTPGELLAALEEPLLPTAPATLVAPAPLVLTEPEGRRLFVLTAPELRFGRKARAPNALCLRLFPIEEHREANANISGEHGRFLVADGRFEVEHDAVNGLELNGQALARSRPEPVGFGDALSVGGALDLELWTASGGLLITRRDNRPGDAYLWLQGRVDLRDLAPEPIAAAFPARLVAHQGQVFIGALPDPRSHRADLAPLTPGEPCQALPSLSCGPGGPEVQKAR